MTDMVVDNIDCVDTEEHEGHKTTGTRTFTCTGMTECGEKTHEPHRVTAPVMFWCNGICKCGFYDYPHGFGNHK